MRRRILMLVIGMTVLVVLAFAVPIAIVVRSVVAQRVENSTQDQATAVVRFIENGTPTTASITSYLAKLPSDDDHRTWVVTDAGTVIGHPPQGANTDAPGQYGAGGPGAGDPRGPRPQLRPEAGGQVAQALARSGAANYSVFVYVSAAALHQGEYEWWVLLVVGSLALLAVGVVGGEIVTRRIVRPLEHTADTAHRLGAGDITARASTDGPREVAEVGAALNQLADRIDELIVEERETVADLSHRMRTPLTALRLDAEALADPEDADRIGEHVSALERTLTAVIRAARRPQREGRAPAADATAVVGARVAFWSALTDEQERRAAVSLPTEPVWVRCAAEDLAAAVDALVENVVAHTPEGTGFAVTLRGTEDGALLEVADDGPGLPDAGVAVRGRSDRGSSGLGLSIARQCAEASGGSMAAGRSPSGGTLVALHLGPAAPPQPAPIDS